MKEQNQGKHIKGRAAVKVGEIKFGLVWFAFFRLCYFIFIDIWTLYYFVLLFRILHKVLLIDNFFTFIIVFLALS